MPCQGQAFSVQTSPGHVFKEEDKRKKKKKEKEKKKKDGKKERKKERYVDKITVKRKQNGNFCDMWTNENPFSMSILKTGCVSL